MPDAVKEIEKQDNQAAPAETAETPDASGKKKSAGLKNMLIVVAGLQVVMAASAFSFVKFYLAPKIQHAYETPAQAETAPRERGEIHLIENILVNPAGTNGTRFLSTSIGVETSKSEAGGENEKGGGFAEISPIIRDMLIAVLSSKTMEELSSVEGKNRLRDEILLKLNSAVAPDSIFSVYFVDYVLQ